MLIIIFFKQKTAYEMRISDWSSDVCSSDLVGFAQQKDEFDKLGVKVVAASVDPIEKAKEVADEANFPVGYGVRSEERRVGKESVSTCRIRWSPDRLKKNT